VRDDIRLRAEGFRSEGRRERGAAGGGGVEGMHGRNHFITTLTKRFSSPRQTLSEKAAAAGAATKAD
jgi:hypothetical protein